MQNLPFVIEKGSDCPKHYLINARASASNNTSSHLDNGATYPDGHFGIYDLRMKFLCEKQVLDS
jgi:hypothetical protein